VNIALQFIFWISIAAVGYAYAVYPALIYCLLALVRPPPDAAGNW
jgi:hypothetical protein